MYSSTNSKHLLNLARSWGYEDAGHWLGFDGNDWLANDLLGVKYILSKSDVNLNNGMLNLIYDNGKIRIWENVDWSGFGYLCWDEIPDPYEINDSRQRLSMFLTKSYYRTGNQGGLPNVDINQVDLIPYLQEYYDCDVIVNGDGISITSVGIDAQLIFSIPKIQNIYGADIHMELECSESGIAQVFSIAEGENYSESNSYKVAYESGKMISTYRIPSEQAVSIRLDPTMVSGQKIQLEVLNLEFVEEESLQEQQKKQVESVDTLVLQEDTFRGVVTNTRQEEAMLCIPVIYSNFWKAEVDGIPVSVENINGGLVGMSIPSGTHNFTLSYDNTVYEVARIVNVVAIVIYVVILAKVFANQKKNQKNTK